MLQRLAELEQKLDRIERNLDAAYLCILLLAVKVGQNMSQTQASGHTGAQIGDVQPLSLIIGEALTVAAGTLRAMWQDPSTADKVFRLDGTENAANRYVGLLRAGTYAIGDTVQIWPDGAQLPVLGTPYDGELYAKSDGTLVATLALAVAIGSWSLKVAKSTSVSVQVIEGQVEEREL